MTFLRHDMIQKLPIVFDGVNLLFTLRNQWSPVNVCWNLRACLAVGSTKNR
jgi:hypothetical protein